MESPTLQSAIDIVTAAVQDRRIALFTGAGFTKALLKNSPNWGQLLESIWDGLDSKAKQEPHKSFGDFIGPGKSYYRIADEMADVLKPEKKGDDPRAFMRSQVAEKLPSIEKVDRDVREDWENILKILNPSVCVTTNYDLILEKLMRDARTCCGTTPATHTGESVPVYHMHGSVMNPQNIVLFEADSINSMLPNSYASIKIPSLFYEYLTIMVGYSLGDPNVSYFLGLSRFLGEKVHEKHKLILINYRKGGNHNSLREKDGMVVIESIDVKNTLKTLLKDLLVEEIAARVTELEKGFHGYWNSTVQPDQAVLWGECADFLNHVLSELEKEYKTKDKNFRHVFPVYAKWLNEALGWCGHSFGMSFEGQRNWEGWHGPAKALKKDLLGYLKKEASEKDLKALQVSLEE